MQLRERGVWVKVQTDSDSVEGWLVGELPQGLLVATEKQLDFPLLVRRSSWRSTSYDHKRPKHPTLFREDAGELQERMFDLEGVLQPPLEKAFRRLDFHQLVKFSQRADELRWHAYDTEHIADLVGLVASKTDAALRLHEDVFLALEDSGLLEALQENASDLRSIPREFLLPAADLEFQSEDELIAHVSDKAESLSISKHKEQLDLAFARRDNLILRSRNRTPSKASEEPPKKESDATLLSRWAGPTLRIIAGTGLASANAALGITAGLTSNLVSIEATVVPVYVGVATSIYTGIGQVADGLEKIGRSK
ncbi:hypothetical protein ACVWYU_000960 [Pseudomonas sp. TE12234]